MPSPSDRVDEHGLAYAGSQRQIQLWVNRNQRELSDQILAALHPRQSAAARIRWVSPLEDQRYAEYYDRNFLHAVGCERLASQLVEFWPKGGPHWDALAVVEDPSPNARRGVILVEAKSYPKEVYGGGCGATSRSRERIGAALQRTKTWLRASDDSDWTGPLYQSANRLAHLYFLRKVSDVPTWLVNVYFLNDPRSPTSQDHWLAALPSIKRELGLVKGAPPFVVDLFLEAWRE